MTVDVPSVGMKMVVTAVPSHTIFLTLPLYSHEGRPSIPPEQLLSALLLQVLYGLRSERQFIEQLSYNLLFR